MFLFFYKYSKWEVYIHGYSPMVCFKLYTDEIIQKKKKTKEKVEEDNTIFRRKLLWGIATLFKVINKCS